MSKKIFIIDDADFMVDMICIILKDAGYSIAGSSTDSSRAIEDMRELSASLGASAVDAVLVDLHMPKLDGFAVIQEIRGIFPNAKILLVSANSSRPVALKAVELKVDGFVVKPFEPDVFLTEVEKLFSPSAVS